MKIFGVEYMKESVIEEIKKIENAYYSESEECFAVSDQLMKEITEKYNITTNEDFAEPEFEDKYNFVEHIYTGIEQWIEWHYSDEVVYFGKSFYLPDYAECVKLVVEDWDDGEFSFDGIEDWAIEVYKILMSEVSIGIKIELDKELDRAVSNGYNFEILKKAFDEFQSSLDYEKRLEALA